MNKQDLVEGIRKTLDWNAQEYGKYTDIEVKEEIAKEFRTEVRAFNLLLREMEMFVDDSEITRFPRNIETYIMIRACENWK